MLSDVEEKQCRNCYFSKVITDPGDHADEFPMCWEVEGQVTVEGPVEALDEQPDGTVVCTKYQPY